MVKTHRARHLTQFCFIRYFIYVSTWCILLIFCLLINYRSISVVPWLWCLSFTVVSMNILRSKRNVSETDGKFYLRIASLRQPWSTVHKSSSDLWGSESAIQTPHLYRSSVTADMTEERGSLNNIAWDNVARFVGGRDMNCVDEKAGNIIMNCLRYTLALYSISRREVLSPWLSREWTRIGFKLSR